MLNLAKVKRFLVVSCPCECSLRSPLAPGIVRTLKGIKWTCRHMGYHEKLFTTSLYLSILRRAVLCPLSFNCNFQNNVTIMWWTNFIETKQLGESRGNLVQRHTPSAKITQITNDKTIVFKWLAESSTLWLTFGSQEREGKSISKSCYI